MAHAVVYGLTKIKVTLDHTDNNDVVLENKVQVKSYGFMPFAAGDGILVGELQGDGSIIGLPLTSIGGDPIGEMWDTGDTEITPAIDMSGCNITGQTVVVFNIVRQD